MPSKSSGKKDFSRDDRSLCKNSYLKLLFWTSYFWPRPRFTLYLLSKTLLSTGERCIFRPKKRDQFWSCFFPSVFPLFLPQNGSKMLFHMSRCHKPRKKTDRNGVFYMVFFRLVCQEGGLDPYRQKAPNTWKQWCFQAFFVPLNGNFSFASWSQKSENSVSKTPFRFIDSAKTWCIAKKGLLISCTRGGL